MALHNGGRTFLGDRPPSLELRFRADWAPAYEAYSTYPKPCALSFLGKSTRCYQRLRLQVGARGVYGLGHGVIGGAYRDIVHIKRRSLKKDNIVLAILIYLHATLEHCTQGPGLISRPLQQSSMLEGSTLRKTHPPSKNP